MALYRAPSWLSSGHFALDAIAIESEHSISPQMHPVTVVVLPACIGNGRVEDSVF